MTVVLRVTLTNGFEDDAVVRQNTRRNEIASGHRGQKRWFDFAFKTERGAKNVERRLNKTLPSAETEVREEDE